MAGSSRTTFAKRQKERARQEKRLEKLQRKTERKKLGGTGTATPEKQSFGDLVETQGEDGQPRGLDFHDFGK